MDMKELALLARFVHFRRLGYRLQDSYFRKAALPQYAPLSSSIGYVLKFGKKYAHRLILIKFDRHY